MSKLKQPIGATGSLSDLIIENFLRVNGVQGSENCRIAGIVGEFIDESDFAPVITFDQLAELSELNDLFLLIEVNAVNDSCSVVGWCHTDQDETDPETLTFFKSIAVHNSRLHIPNCALSTNMDLFIQRLAS